MAVSAKKHTYFCEANVLRKLGNIIYYVSAFMKQTMEEYMRDLDTRITGIERCDTSQWVDAVQKKVDLVSAQQAAHSDTLEDVMRTVLTDIARLSGQVQKLESTVEDLGERLEDDREASRR